jgi:hypothetical protein
MAAVFTAATVVMTWPLAIHPAALPASDDAYFSVWRMAWVAHQLPIDPLHLFDANSFHPAAGTLAYSDAMLLVGLVAAPLFWLELEPARVHNLMLLLAFVTSMHAAYLLARRLTGERLAAVLSAVIFGFCAYRFAHIGHLELQFVGWMPLAMLALHRLFEAPSAARGLALGAALSAQVLSSIYYGAFLAVYLAVGWLALAAGRVDRARVLRSTLAAALPLAIVAAIYGPPYARARAEVGPRPATEVARFSAVPADYLRVPPENRLRGARPPREAHDERSLFPGFVALAFAAAAFWPPVARLTWIYGVLALAAFDLSLGVNGVLFGVLDRVVPIVSSFRAPARFGILTVLALACLAALAAARLHRRTGWRAVTIAAIGLAMLESVSRPLTLRPFPSAPSEAHQFLSTLPDDTVVLELPLPTLGSLWRHEALHQAGSIHHWTRLVNGYSGFVPPEYVTTLQAMEQFPDRTSIARLRAIDVDFLVVNREHYAEPEFRAVEAALIDSPDFEHLRRFGRGRGEVIVISLRKPLQQ